MLVALLPLSLLFMFSTTAAITLTDFQPINGFSSQCTQAYNTPLQGCTQSDFQGGHTCSTGCITFLEALTKMLNTDCKGTSAFPNTLIGLFFSQQGTSTLCPNVLGSSGGEGGDQSLYSSAASPDGPSTSVGGAQKTSAAMSRTSTPASSASTTMSPSSATLSSASQSSTTGNSASSTIVDMQTNAEPTDTATNSISSINSISSTASASKTSSAPGASNTGKEADTGGGGTILELGSTGAAPLRMQCKSCWWMLLGIMGILFWLA